VIWYVDTSGTDTGAPELLRQTPIREPCGCKIRGPEAVFWPRRAYTSRAGGDWDLRVVLCIAGLNQRRDVGSARDLLRLRMVRRISPEGSTARFCGALHLSSVKSSEWLIQGYSQIPGAIPHPVKQMAGPRVSRGPILKIASFRRECNLRETQG